MHATSAGDRAEARSLGPNDVSMGVARWDFESLYAATYPDMVRLAYLLTGSLAQAEEVTRAYKAGYREGRLGTPSRPF